MSTHNEPPASTVLKAVIRDLKRQAETENSHFYTARVLQMMLDYIETVDIIARNAREACPPPAAPCQTEQGELEKAAKGALRILQNLWPKYDEQRAALHDALSRQPAAARDGVDDTRRLDWLEREHTGCNFGPRDHPNKFHVWVYETGIDLPKHYYGLCLRQAIDAAMKGTP